MEQITVVESLAGKFGPQLKDNKGFLSFGKFYKGETSFPVGTVLNVELFVSTKGNRYINSVESISSGTIETPKRGRKVKTANEVVAELPTTPKAVNWDELGRGKTASLFVAALLQNPNVTQSLEVDIELMEMIVWDLVDVVFRTRKEKV